MLRRPTYCTHLVPGNRFQNQPQHIKTKPHRKIQGNVPEFSTNVEVTVFFDTRFWWRFWRRSFASRWRWRFNMMRMMVLMIIVNDFRKIMISWIGGKIRNGMMMMRFSIVIKYKIMLMMIIVIGYEIYIWFFPMLVIVMMWRSILSRFWMLLKPTGWWCGIFLFRVITLLIRRFIWK